MNRRSTKRRLGRWLVGSAVIALTIAATSFITGCSNIPNSPAEQDHSLSALQFVDQKYGDQLATVSDSAQAKLDARILKDLTSLLVGPRGGLLNVDLGGDNCSLKVPPGALIRFVRIVMGAVRVETPWAEATVLEFSPNGLIFLLPTKLTVETERPNGSVLRIYWWNPSTNAWVFQQAAVVRDGCVSFQIRHFSKYGIS